MRTTPNYRQTLYIIATNKITVALHYTTLLYIPFSDSYCILPSLATICSYIHASHECRKLLPSYVATNYHKA